MKQNNSIYKFYFVRLSSTPIPQLVQYFNNEVGSHAWTTQRAAFDTALIEALIYKGIDVSEIYDGHSIIFKRKITYEATSNNLVPIE